MMALEEAKDILDRYVNGCSDHKPVSFTGDDLAEVLYSHTEGNPNEYDDTSSVVVARLLDGRIGVFWERSDSTGHG